MKTIDNVDISVQSYYFAPTVYDVFVILYPVLFSLSSESVLFASPSTPESGEHVVCEQRTLCRSLSNCHCSLEHLHQHPPKAGGLDAKMPPTTPPMVPVNPVSICHPRANLKIGGLLGGAVQRLVNTSDRRVPLVIDIER